MDAPDRTQRARMHAALGDEHRLAIVDELTLSDRSPSELSGRFGMAGNLLAHHLDVLEEAGLIQRFVSAGDRRRRYVRLLRSSLTDLGVATSRPVSEKPDSVLFVCSHNSARSQLAAALWHARTGGRASSAGTHPADRVHPGAVAAAERVGVDLSTATPRLIDERTTADLVVTVCDQAHEELDPQPQWWHWSLADPVVTATDEAFDTVVAELDARIHALAT